MNFFVVVIAFLLGVATTVTVGTTRVTSFLDGIREFFSGIVPPIPPV